MKTIFAILFLFISMVTVGQKKKEIRFLLAKDASQIDFQISPDSTRASFYIKTPKDFSLKTDSKSSDSDDPKTIYFGFIHRKSTTIKSLPSVTLEEYYANISNYTLSPRIYLIIPFNDKIFGIWKCSVINSK